MVAFGFLAQILGGGGDLRIMTLLKNECSLSGWDTQILLAALENSTFMHSQAVAKQKLQAPAIALGTISSTYPFEMVGILNQIILF